MEELKRKQQESFNQTYRGENTGEPSPTPVALWLWEREMREGLCLAGGSVAGMTGLSLCCGRGAEAEWFAVQGAIVTATDISSEAVNALQNCKTSQIMAEVADAEHLPYADNSFDFAFVRHGLHHLPRPYLGIYEMLRVARRFVIIWEAQDNWLIRRLAGGHLLGLLPSGGETEPSGNYVYRFSRRELEKISRGMFLPSGDIRCTWHHNNQPVEFLHRKIFRGRVGFAVAKLMYTTLDAFFGYCGNNMVAVFRL